MLVFKFESWVRYMLLSLLISLLISNAITIRRDKSILYSRITIKSLILSSLLLFSSLDINALDKGIGIYGGLFNVTLFSQTFNVFIFIVSATILILTAFYPRKINVSNYISVFKSISKKFVYNKNSISSKTGEQFRIIEYPLIIIFVVSGAVFLISTGDLVSIFLSIELQSYGLYILCTLYRDSESATASGLMYFLLGGLSSCFILLGSALLYANSGTTSLDNIYIITTISESNPFSIYKLDYLNMSIIILSVGFLFKVSAAPFHFWSPDVYDGIPTIVTTYVAIVAKLAIFAFLFELVYYTDYISFGFSWKNILIISSLLSLVVGSILGLTQFRIKRLYAYSTISHVGFILLALSINSVESLQSFIFYLLQYTVSNINAFLILLSIGFTLYLYNSDNKQENMTDKNNSPIQLISQIKGYFYINSFISISFAITIFSFIGIPPMIGFFAKQMILSAALDAGYVFMSLIAIITSVVGAGYYLNLIKNTFFFKSDHEIADSVKDMTLYGYFAHDDAKGHEDEKIENDHTKPDVVFTFEDIKLNSALSSVISFITLLITLFIFIPEEWFNIIFILTMIQFKG